MMCDIPVSEHVSEDYRVYTEYRTSLIALQQDIAQLYLELQQKNLKAGYQHVLQTIETTAVLIGKAEAASHNVYNGFQGSLRGHLELICEYGFSEEQKRDLMNMGYTGEDIAHIKKSLAHYNDYYYHAAEEFNPEQIQWFSSMGLTDAQILDMQTAICDHYTQIHTLEEEIKQHQTELLYIQVSLSLAALKMLLDQEDKGKGRSDELKNAEERLLEAIATVSEDQSSLEKVKAYSKQVYKAAEQKIRKGEPQYMTDFFIGLQVHCGAVTALHGDTEFGLTEIKSYEHVLSECIRTERSESFYEQNTPVDDQLPSSDTVSVLDFTGQVEESDEDNNAGYIIVVVKTFGTTLLDFIQLMAEWGIPEMAQQLFEKFLIKCIDLAVNVAKFVCKVGGVIFTLIMTAPPVGGSWVDCVVPCMTEDPSGTFLQIFEDKDTVATIEAGAYNYNTDIDDCERIGYYMVYTDPMQIVYTIMHAVEVYRSPNNHYFYYMVNYSGGWVVEVEVLEHECCGRVARAYKVNCNYKCNDIPCTIREKWVLCDNFTLVWTRSQPDNGYGFTSL